MKNGILRDDEGYDIVINRVWRSFRDIKDVALGSARYYKGRHPGEQVQVRDRSNGNLVTMLDDGQTA